MHQQLGSAKIFGYIIAGFLIGPMGFDLVPDQIMELLVYLGIMLFFLIVFLSVFFNYQKEGAHIRKKAFPLAVIPNALEFGYYVLVACVWMEFNILEAAVLASILSAACPLMLIPAMQELKSKGIGSNQQIPSLIVTAATQSMLFSVFSFSIFFVLLLRPDFNNGAFWFVQKGKLFVFFFIILGASIIGLLTIFTFKFKTIKFSHFLSEKIKVYILVAEAFLFICIGAQVKHLSIDWKFVMVGIGIILGGFVVRSSGIFLSLQILNFSLKEILFSMIALIQKTTMPAAFLALLSIFLVEHQVIILTLMVLPILMSVPLSNLSIYFLKETLLENSFEQIRLKGKLPGIGARVRSKKFQTIWRIIEEKEIWLTPSLKNIKPKGIETDGNKTVGATDAIPIIQIRFWHEDAKLNVGMGKTMSHGYGIDDDTFPKHWEVITLDE